MRRVARAVKAFWFELRKKAAKPGQLREFVYLDETSVESLLASLDGEVLTGITESRSKGYELGLSATGAAPGVPAGLSPSAKRTRSVTVEEQRKSVAQSAFARLRSRHYQNLRLEADQNSDSAIRKDIDSAKDLEIASVRRGDLIEVDAILSASEVFRVKTVIDSMIGVVNAFPDLIPPSALAAIRAGEPVGALLGSLSQGLIPIEGTVVGYRSVWHEGKDWIVPDSVAQELERMGGRSQNVVIAGVTLSPLRALHLGGRTQICCGRDPLSFPHFVVAGRLVRPSGQPRVLFYWHDTRRVLFSEYRYRVLGRLVHDGAKSSWSAVKLTDVLKDVNVELSDTINSLGPMFLKALQEGEDGGAGAVATRARFMEILPYARQVAEVAALSWTSSLEDKITEAIPQSTRDELDAETWREKQLAINDVIFSNTFNLVSPQTLSRVRQNHSLPAVDSSRLVDQGSNALVLKLSRGLRAPTWNSR